MIFAAVIRRHAPSMLVVTIAGLAMACARTAAPGDFAPVTGDAPRGTAPSLVVDSSVAVSLVPPSTPTVGARMGQCAAALRDPVSGVRYLLMQAQRVQTHARPTASGSVVTTREQANYLPDDTVAYRLPAGRYLRVECGTHKVLGLGASLEAGT